MLKNTIQLLIFFKRTIQLLPKITHHTISQLLIVRILMYTKKSVDKFIECLCMFLSFKLLSLISAARSIWILKISDEIIQYYLLFFVRNYSILVLHVIQLLQINIGFIYLFHRYEGR